MYKLQFFMRTYMHALNQAQTFVILNIKSCFILSPYAFPKLFPAITDRCI